MDGIGQDIVPGKKLLLPAGRIIVEPDERRSARSEAAMVEKREITKSKLASGLSKKLPEVLGARAAARLLLEDVGKPR